jgi:hypothetical protein
LEQDEPEYVYSRDKITKQDNNPDTDGDDGVGGGK